MVQRNQLSYIYIYIHTVWANGMVAVISLQIIHLEIHRDVVVPQLRTKANFDELYFQQDGAPSHYTRTVRDYLHRVFPQRWFGRHWFGSIEWPPNSPDLTPTDFFLWGVVKIKVYEINPHTVNELKECISDAFTVIDGDRNLCRTVLEYFEEIRRLLQGWM